MAGRTPDRSEYLAAAREMAATGHPILARLMAEEAADLTEHPEEAARILRDFPDRSLCQEG